MAVWLVIMEEKKEKSTDVSTFLLGTVSSKCALYMNIVGAALLWLHCGGSQCNGKIYEGCKVSMFM